MSHLDGNPMKISLLFQEIQQLTVLKNTRKQRTFSHLLGYISKSILASSDSFYLIVSNLFIYLFHSSTVQTEILGLSRNNFSLI